MPIGCWLRTVFMALSLLILFQGRCQSRSSNFLDSFSIAVGKQLKANETEQAYLTTNKYIYTAGETIWLRVFLLRSISDRLSTLSKTVFVDVVNKEDKRISSALLNSGAQQFQGTVFLPDSLPSGNYWVRAYTGSILALDPERAAVVPIYFFNPRLPDSTFSDRPVKEKDGDAPLLHFYAEGGALISNVPSAIVLHITDKEGQPMEINGTIRDMHEAVVGVFSTNAQGFGKTIIQPEQNGRYHAVIQWKAKTISYELPPFRFSAGQLTVSRNALGAFVVRTLLDDSLDNKVALTYLIGLSKGEVYFAGVGHGQYEVAVSERKFPRGLATFLLVDSSGHILSERNVYVRSGNVDFQTDLDKPDYSKRNKVVWSTAISDTASGPLPSELAVSVADDRTAAMPSVNNYSTINALLAGRENNWLMAHLKELTEDEMDLVVFCIQDHFKRINAIKQANRTASTDSLFYIKGKVLDANNRPISHKSLTLFAAGSLGSFWKDTTDASGRFCFPFEGYPDSSRFLLQVGKNNAFEKTVKLSLDTMRFPDFATPLAIKQPLELYAPELTSHFYHFADTVAGMNRKGMMKTVVVKAAKPLYLKQRASFTSTLITSDALIERGRVTLGDAFLGRTDVDLLSTSKYPVLIIDGNVFPFANDLPSTGKPSGGGKPPGRPEKGGGTGLQAGGDEPGDTRDFSPVYHYLNSLIIKDIDFIEILSPMVALEYSPRGRYGGIFIHTKTADGIYEESGLHLFYARGYCRDTLFPLVTYQHADPVSEKLTDRRSTFFWSGNLWNGTPLHRTAEFYTNDIPGFYSVTISGVTAQGDILYDSLTFEVK